MAIRTFSWPAQSLSIPGVATEATLQDVLTELQAINIDTNGLATEATLGSIDTKLSGTIAVSGPLTDAQLRASAVPVSGPLTDAELRATDVPVSATSLPLPTGAATETTLGAVSTSLIEAANNTSPFFVLGPLTDTELRATPVPVSATNLDIRDLAFATDKVDASGSSVSISGSVAVTGPLTDSQLRATPVDVSATNLDIRDLTSGTDSVSAVQSGTWNVNNISGTVSLPTGAATETTLSSIDTKTPALGQALMAASVPVTIASNQSTLPVQSAGRTKVAVLRNDYSSTSVSTSAYTQLTASTSAIINKLQIFDSSGSALVLAVGAAASEVDQIYIFPGGNGDVELTIPSGSRISIKAVDTAASVGQILINCLS